MAVVGNNPLEMGYTDAWIQESLLPWILKLDKMILPPWILAMFSLQSLQIQGQEIDKYLLVAWNEIVLQKEL